VVHRPEARREKEMPPVGLQADSVGRRRMLRQGYRRVLLRARMGPARPDRAFAGFVLQDVAFNHYHSPCLGNIRLHLIWPKRVERI
jgi:hypothetical protein